MLIHLIVILLVIGLLLWAAEQLPIDATIKGIIRVLVIVVAVLYVLQSFGLISGIPL